ncbi:MAG TPA: hypothetical protein VG929_09315 [Actinomycetota bacterium]|nr:hypothetical protein [Actinomycetota bacterium]
MRYVPRKLAVVACGALAVMIMVSGLGRASTTAAGWTGASKEVGLGPRAQFPEDRYALAGGCYAMFEAGGRYVARSEDGFALGGSNLDAAEPFFLQATDLGRYLLFGREGDFLAASEGALATATYAATDSVPGQIAGGVAFEQTDVAADEVADSAANRASGRGAAVVAASEPGPLADWKVVQHGLNTFRLELPATDQALAAKSGELVLVPTGDGDSFGFELLPDGCATFPEVEVNVDGPLMGGQTSFQETRGFMDLHLHGMAYEFLGGRARCAKPWSRYGVAQALVDCPDHHPGGEAAALEQLLSNTPGKGHSPDGWPTFKGWPKHNYLTHEQLYYKWLERAWRGGLRLYTNVLVDNAALCKAYPFKDRHAIESRCNEMDGVRLQHKRILQLQDYIDAQSGGPGEGWFRIVKDPFEAREVINSGRLAVIIGIEVSTLFDCGLRFGQALCDTDDIDRGLEEAYEKLDVRQMELVNKFDSALSGVTGDAGQTGLIVNQGNMEETGRYWQMDTCPEDAGHAHDKTQHNVHDSPPYPNGWPREFTGRDSLVASILAAAGTSGAAPLYPPAPHCNELGLTELGEYTIRQMAQRGMIFDPDHMSARARTSAMDLIIDELQYSGVVSSHSWADDTIYPRIYEAGGVVTPSDSDLRGFEEDWIKSKAWADERYYFGFGYGSDVNGFSSSAPPIKGTTVSYPFEGFGGAMVHQQVSGERIYDINSDGVAHYGLYTDWLQGLRQINDALYEDMTRGPEAYLQMWERAVGVPGDACRADVPDLTQDRIDAVAPGTSWKDVLFALGQPSSRAGNEFTYCVEGGTTAVITFDDDGRVAGGSETEPSREPKPCPANRRPVPSGDGHPSSRRDDVPGKACGRR